MARGVIAYVIILWLIFSKVIKKNARFSLRPNGRGIFYWLELITSVWRGYQESRLLNNCRLLSTRTLW